MWIAKLIFIKPISFIFCCKLSFSSYILDHTAFRILYLLLPVIPESARISGIPIPFVVASGAYAERGNPVTMPLKRCMQHRESSYGIAASFHPSQRWKNNALPYYQYVHLCKMSLTYAGAMYGFNFM
jgi:hypothetical protein